MGFLKPSKPKPPPPPPKPVQIDDARITQAAGERRSRLARTQGRSSTILTGPLGASTEGLGGAKTLLGS